MYNGIHPGYRTLRGYQMAARRGNGLTPAMEDYLEMTCRLCLENGYTRVGRLSEVLNVRPSSASKMILRLAELGFLKYDSYESILPTQKGKEAGAYLIYRHETVERFLKLLGNASPLEEAELIEHFMSRPTVDSLDALLRFLHGDDDLLERFEAFQRAGSDEGGDKKQAPPKGGVP
jgi:DtxR family Mn-dependent transcriptional regulator